MAILPNIFDMLKN